MTDSPLKDWCDRLMAAQIKKLRVKHDAELMFLQEGCGAIPRALRLLRSVEETPLEGSSEVEFTQFKEYLEAVLKLTFEEGSVNED